MYHCDNTSGWLPLSFVYVREERTISKREEVYHETESRMRVNVFAATVNGTRNRLTKTCCLTKFP